jgi:tRNA (guanosine-2'-O-)-methyltransferase
MDRKTKVKLCQHLSSFLTEKRKELFDQVIQDRTRYLTVVMEDLYQPHNASAVLRTCDCLGIQDVHIIENANTYEVNPDIALGSSKWLTLHRYSKEENNTMRALNNLRERGYQIVATSPHMHDCSLPAFEIEKKTALLFGTELNGLSPLAIDQSDAFLKIPIFGFTESYNISVSAGILLYQLIEKLKRSSLNWQLSKDEILDIKLQWIRNSLKRGQLIEQKFLNSL